MSKTAATARLRLVAKPSSKPALSAKKGVATRADATALPAATEAVNTRYLETLLGYNARRAALSVIEVFLERMSVYGLRPVEFSVLSVVSHNPGVTSRQLCTALGIQPPNLVRLVADLDQRGLLLRKPHPTDGRAIGLHLTAAAGKLMREAEITANELEDDVASALSTAERATLMRLLKKIYQRTNEQQGSRCDET